MLISLTRPGTAFLASIQRLIRSRSALVLGRAPGTAEDIADAPGGVPSHILDDIGLLGGAEPRHGIGRERDAPSRTLRKQALSCSATPSWTWPGR